jgi:bifunctional non-homologous end joining protein LigD
VKAFSRALVEAMVHDAPELYLAKASKAERRGKIFLDWLRNARGASAVCPYSVRARAGAPVATPIAWSELGPKLDPARFDVAAVLRRLGRLRVDPWKGYAELRQALPSAR